MSKQISNFFNRFKPVQTRIKTTYTELYLLYIMLNWIWRQITTPKIPQTTQNPRQRVGYWWIWRETCRICIQHEWRCLSAKTMVIRESVAEWAGAGALGAAAGAGGGRCIEWRSLIYIDVLENTHSSRDCHCDITSHSGLGTRDSGRALNTHNHLRRFP